MDLRDRLRMSRPVEPEGIHLRAGRQPDPVEFADGQRRQALL
jgi:hypothetical protein